MKKIVTLGGVMRDIFIEYESAQMLHLQGTQSKQTFILIEEGRKIDVKNIAYHVGGGAANSAVSFARLGFNVEAFFKVGDDQEGVYVIEELAKENVSTQHVVHAKDQKTGSSFIIPCSSGNKAILAYRGANLTLEENELPWDAIASCDQLYITSLSAHASRLLLPITNYAKKYNKPVAVNPGTSQLDEGAQILRDSLKNIDILILNSDEAQQFMLALVQTNSALLEETPQQSTPKNNLLMPRLLQSPLTYQHICFSFQQYFRQVLSRGPKIVVVTDGAQGVYVATKDTIYFYPSLPSKVISTIGAGDAFGSCFVASLAQGKTIEQALVAGSLNSHSVIEHVGTQTGLLTQKNLEEMLKKANMNLLQKFNL